MTAAVTMPGSARARRWAKDNLFNGRLNSVLTVVIAVAATWLAWSAIRFVFVTAEWEIVRRNLVNFMIGRFPRDQLWRPWASGFAVATTAGLVAGSIEATAMARAEESGLEPVEPDSVGALARRFSPLLVLIAALLAMTRTVAPTVLTAAVGASLLGARLVGRRWPPWIRRRPGLVAGAGMIGAYALLVAGGGVGWGRWGGFHLSIFATVVGIAVAFPFGLLLALGRRSSLPVIRWLSIAYIETFRGVPLITLLIMADTFLGFFLPSGFDSPALVTRALVAIILFEAAYVAEVVRGGLLAVPAGQIEASQALGMPPAKTTRLIVLPQALRAVIPAMVGQFISLWKDTSLLAGIGLFELLDVARNVTSQPDFLGQGLSSVTLPFAGFVYWSISYTMSKESQRLERRLGVGER